MGRKKNSKLAPACLLFVLTACDPCSGIVDCGQAPRVVVVGQVLAPGAGHPVPGARIEMRREDGVELTAEAASTSTRANGMFLVEIDAKSEGPSRVTLLVASPGETAYEIRGLQARATVVSGESTVLKPIKSAHPVVPIVVEIFRNGTTDERIANAEVDFRRTGGTRLFSNGIEVQRAFGTTNEIGWAAPFDGLTTDAANDVVGDLIVRFGSPTDSAVFANVTFGASAWFTPSKSIFRLGVGPN